MGTEVLDGLSFSTRTGRVKGPRKGLISFISLFHEIAA
jgi:hypothetical protein